MYFGIIVRGIQWSKPVKLIIDLQVVTAIFPVDRVSSADFENLGAGLEIQQCCAGTRAATGWKE